MRFETTVSAPPAEVFSYVSDLTKHGEWSGNPLEIVPLDDNATEAIKVGRRYKSTATVKNLMFDAELGVTEYAPNERFAFSGSDATGEFTHTFTFKPTSAGTHIERLARFDLSLYLWVRFWVLYLPIRKPAGQKAMARLSEKWAK